MRRKTIRLLLFLPTPRSINQGKRESLLQSDLDKITNWFSYNNLSLTTSDADVI